MKKRNFVDFGVLIMMLVIIGGVIGYNAWRNSNTPPLTRLFDDKLDVVCWLARDGGLACLPANTVNIEGLKEVLGIVETLEE